MKELKQALHMALRDDDTAAVGIRALLGQAATPWGVYQRYLPEQPDFSSNRGYLIWALMSGIPGDSSLLDAKLREVVFTVTVWCTDIDVVDSVLKRSRDRLEGKRKVTLPTANTELHEICWEGTGPDLFDENFQVSFRQEQYRIFYREDVTA